MTTPTPLVFDGALILSECLKICCASATVIRYDMAFFGGKCDREIKALKKKEKFSGMETTYAYLAEFLGIDGLSRSIVAQAARGWGYRARILVGFETEERKGPHYDLSVFRIAGGPRPAEAPA